MREFDFKPHERRLIETARAFARDYMRPRAADWEASRKMPRDALKEAARVGLTYLDAPGPDHPQISFACKLLVLEALSEEDFGFAFSLTNTQGIASRIAVSGTDSQKERFLADLQSTKRLGATCLSEPGAGSDFAGITTNATKVDGGWRLNGAKGWITNAAEADVFIVHAQTDPALRGKGIATFLVDGTKPGFERTAPESLLGGHAIGVGGFTLTDYFVPDDDVLSLPGEAFKTAMASVNRARTYVAGMVNAMVRSSLRHAASYGAKRQAFGKSLLENQGLSWSLTDVANQLEASKLLTYRAAQIIDEGGDAMLPAAHAKKFAGDYGVHAISACIQAMGARGMRSDIPLSRHLACAKLACYTDGSTEMMNERLAKSLAETSGA
jgi:alkylation response protein AidB-like acyl-CoA dehydrogenase